MYLISIINWMKKIAIVLEFSFNVANAQGLIKKVTDNISGGVKTEVNIELSFVRHARCQK